MYSNELNNRIIELLAPAGFTDRTESEACYQPRQLAEGAIVTRSAPSPTGFVHIGTIYMSLINKLVALQSRGVNFLRIEDTDKSREIKNGISEIVEALETFDLRPLEGVDKNGESYGDYGPYIQSQRAKIYLGYAIDLLKKGRAYVCFASPEELEANYKTQQKEKVRPGYYGKWALWRDKSEKEVGEALDANRPFVLRFRSEGSHSKRLSLEDALKGKLELPENDLDIPLIKSDEYRLPTYHLAHVVDDFLMKANIILRGDEWLPSTPLHTELCRALDIKPFRYAHFAPINIMDGASRRKLSKRKDPEADTKFFIADGYPTKAILEYLVGLANSNFEEWRINNPEKELWDFPFSFEKWAKARGALLDLKKLDDVSKNLIANMSQEEFEASIRDWAKTNNQDFLNALDEDPIYTKRVLAVEREGEQKRKDISKWSHAPEQYGYFFDSLFSSQVSASAGMELLANFSQSTVIASCQAAESAYNSKDDQAAWFEKFKAAAEKSGFATSNSTFKEKPEDYKGNLADFAKIIRVKLTARNRTPDLYYVMQALGADRVKQRLTA